ncbi:MAG: hypothetical protein IT305_12645 [Chloroflexi bacterium]|nr:hypothetical protein [Chloroflexota bacterium]
MQLTLSAGRIDQLADVLDHHEVVQRVLAGVQVDLDPSQLGSGRGH